MKYQINPETRTVGRWRHLVCRFRGVLMAIGQKMDSWFRKVTNYRSSLELSQMNEEQRLEFEKQLEDEREALSRWMV